MRRRCPDGFRTYGTVAASFVWYWISAGFGDDRLVLEVLSRIDELPKVLQQRIRRASHLHPRVGSDESTSQRARSIE